MKNTHKAYKTQKHEQQAQDLFQKFNKTMHKAATFIDYAVDSISERIAKKKTSSTYPPFLFQTTTFIFKSLEESSTNAHSTIIKYSKKKSNIFGKNNWSSQTIIFTILIFVMILILIGIFLIRLYFNKKQDKLTKDSLRRSIDSTLSSLQE